MEKNDSMAMAASTFYYRCGNDESAVAYASDRLPAVPSVSCFTIRC
jgi:hypothetical protein